MREILFRGKTFDNEWVYGYYVNQYKCSEIYCQDTSVGERRAIIPETIGQYTGLTDKNGTKIFEFDIVVYNHRYYEIRYIEKYARFAPILPNTVFCVFAYDQGEVVGNIFDNPELLKGVVR